MSLDPGRVRDLLKGSWFIHDYDQIETDPDRVAILDLAIPAFLGAAPTFLSMRQSLLVPDPGRLDDVLTRLTELLARVPKATNLWDFSDDEFAALREIFAVALEIKEYGPAAASKLLHRKRPHGIPIIDSRVVASWASEWAGKNVSEVGMTEIARRMAKELAREADALEGVAKEATALGEPFARLTPLRLYDVLSYQLWDGE